MKFNFTKAAIIAAPVGTHYDTKQAGLCVNVTEHSRKYGIYVSIRNNPVRRSLGSVEDKSVEAVRAEAARLIAELRERGVDVPLTIHDLRRTFTVRLIASGASLPIAAKALGHRGLSSIGTYARVATDTVREYLGRV